MDFNFQLTTVEPVESFQSQKLLRGDTLNTWLAGLKGSDEDLISLSKEIELVHNKQGEYWYVVGSRLQRIANERLYRTGGYRSFSDFCARGLGYTRQHSYKLMKAVEFIDELRAKAETQEEQIMVFQLFMLGFTKLYLLHTLPADTLKQLLREGIRVPEKKGPTILTIPLNMVTAGQLKRAITYLRNLQRNQQKMVGEN
jgi:hypothetical protein